MHPQRSTRGHAPATSKLADLMDKRRRNTQTKNQDTLQHWNNRKRQKQLKQRLDNTKSKKETRKEALANIKPRQQQLYRKIDTLRNCFEQVYSVLS